MGLILKTHLYPIEKGEASAFFFFFSEDLPVILSLSSSSLPHPFVQASFLKAVPISLASLSRVAFPTLCCSCMASYGVAAGETGLIQGYAQGL